MAGLLKDILKFYTFAVLITWIVWSGYGTATGIITGIIYFIHSTVLFMGGRIPYQDDSNGASN